MKYDTIIKAAALALVAGTGGAWAGSKDVDANARLAFSDKLSMYGQRIAGSACYHMSDFGPFESRGFLATAAHETNRILNALETGDRALGIDAPEQDDAILAFLSEIKATWFAVDRATQAVLEGDDSAATAELLTRSGEEFLAQSVRLVSKISNKYANTEALKLTDAIRLQVAGRQRALAQLLILQACKTNGADGVVEAREALSETINLFDASATALREGMRSVGLMPTTEPELIAALDRVDAVWARLEWPLVVLVAGDTWDAQINGIMYRQLNELTHELDKAVVAYTRAANAVPAGS